MEQSAEVEENQPKIDCLPSSESSGSHIRINAISIDLTQAMENHQDAGPCDHFSIRGYVAGMREKNIRVCLPFSADDNQNTLEEQKSALPPLDVVKFKWWSCDNCIREVESACCAQEIGKVPDSSPTGYLSKGSCSIKEHFNNAARGGSDVATKLNGNENLISPTGSLSKSSCYIKEHFNNAVRGASDVACTELNRDENLISSRGYAMEKNDKVEQSVPDGSENDAQHEMFAVKGIINSEPAFIPETHGDGSDATGWNTFRNMEVCGPSFEGNISSNIRQLESNGSSSTEIGRTGTSNTPNGQQRMGIGDCEISRQMGSVTVGGINVTKGKTNLSLSLDDLSSESRDRFAKNVHHDKFRDGSSKSIRQRAPKVRLLTELLGSGENAENDQSRTTDSDFDTASDFCDEVTARTIAKQHSKGKRKITHDENKKSPLLPKKSKLSKGDAELAKTNYMVVNPEPEENRCTFVQQKNLKNHVSSKKKHNQTQNEGGSPILMPHPDVAKKYHFAATEGGLSSPVHYMYNNTEMDPYYKRSTSPPKAERQSNMSKKKNIQVGDRRAVPVPQWSNMPGEDLCIRNNYDAYGRKGVGLPLNRYEVVGRNDESHMAKTTIGAEPLSLPWNKSVREGCYQGKDGNSHAGESSIIRKSAPDSGSGKGLLCDLNEKIASQSPILDIQNAIPQFGKGSIQHHRELNMPGVHNNEPKNDDQGKGNDDIPMEIVELLAKNRYDRRRHEFERSHFSHERAKEKRSFESMGLPSLHGSGLLKSYRVEDHSVRNHPPQTTTVKSSEHLAHMKVNSVNSILHINEPRLNMNKTEGKKSAFARCSPFFDSQGNQSGIASYPDSGSIRGNYQNFQWQSGYIGSSFSPQKVRYSTVPNYTHFPPNYAPQASNFGTSFHIPEASKGSSNPFTSKDRGFDLNFVNEHYNNFEKQNRAIGFESFQRSSNPFASKDRGFDLNATVSGSLDLHSNEAIPAMQLLGLMDAGMISNAFPPRDHHRKVLDKPMFLPDHHPKEQFGRAIGVPGNGSRPPSSSSYGKNQWRESYLECPPPAAFGPFASPFQNGSNLKGAYGIPTQIPSKFNEKKKGPAQNSARKSQNPVCETGVSQNIQDSMLVHSIQRGAQCISRTVFPIQSVSSSEICSVNRNPADFSVPEPRNIYMINDRDLKIGKQTSLKGNKGSVNADGKKKQRDMVPAATKPQ